MSNTLVLQSHRQPLPHAWLQACLDSVARWADANGFAYRYLNDALFTPLAPELLAKTRLQPVIATDLARLKWLQRSLAADYRRVVWCDADFLIFDPSRFVLPDAPFALGREVWVQRAVNGRLRSHIKVHNAFLMFCRGNAFLDFYADTAERLLQLQRGGVPPQFIGPKLLTALHNIAHCPVMETAAMLSPAVIRDLLAGGGGALDRFHADSTAPPAGVNLSASLVGAEGFSDNEIATLIEWLCQSGLADSSDQSASQCQSTS